MANVYVDSNAAGSGTGADWTNAYTTMAAAIAKPIADGDVLLVEYRHTYTGAGAVSWAFPNGTFTVLSVDKDDSDNLRVGADEGAGGANAISISGGSTGSFVYFYGIELKGSTNGSGNSKIYIQNGTSDYSRLVWQSCSFTLQSASASATINIGSQSSGNSRSTSCTFYDCTFTAQGATTGEMLLFHNTTARFYNMVTAYSGANKPLELVAIGGQGTCCDVLIADSDLSTWNATGSYLVDVAQMGYFSRVVFENCKMSASPLTGVKTGTFPVSSASVVIRNCDSGNTLNTFEYYDRQGTLTEETSIYADSGAQFNGSAISWKVVTTSVCTKTTPFICPDIMRWNTATTSTNFDVYLNSSTTLTDVTCWMRMGTSTDASFPRYTNYETRASNPLRAAGTTLDAGGSWTGVADNDYRLRITKTPSAVGLVRAMVHIAAATATVYIDPIIRPS